MKRQLRIREGWESNIKGVTQGEKTLKFEKRETKSMSKRINRTEDLFINRSDRGRGRENNKLCMEGIQLNAEEEKESSDPPLKDLSNY